MHALRRFINDLSIKQKGLILVALPILFELIFLSTLLGLFAAGENQRARETHFRTIVMDLYGVNWQLQKSASLLLVYETSRSSDARAGFEAMMRQTLDRMARVKSLVADDPTSAKSIETYNRQLEEMLVIYRRIDDSFDFADGSKISKANQTLIEAELLSRFNALFESSHKLISEQSALIRQCAAEVDRDRSRLALVIVIGFFGHLILSILLTLFFGKQIKTRLDLVMRNISKMAKEEPLLPALDGKDEISQLDSVFHDMASKLELARQKESEMLAMISHDIRGPICAFGLLFDVMTKGSFGELSPHLKDRVVRASNTNKMLIHMITNFLDKEKLREGLMQPSMEAVDLNSIFESARDALMSLAEAKSIQVQINNSVDDLFQADKQMLTQIVLNYLSNAIKFSPANSTVAISGELLESQILVRVKDSGPGIASEHQDMVFERFEQIPNRDRQIVGSGLGLSVCKKLIELHGGTVGIESDGKNGSTFWFSIPATVNETVNTLA